MLSTQASGDRASEKILVRTSQDAAGKPQANIEIGGQHVDAAEVLTENDGKTWKLYCSLPEHDYEFILRAMTAY